jgi:O-methyltransferase involved in polyketide biosynthesis
MNAPEPTAALRDISDTALWVAIYRAQESERPRPLFRDPLARRLAGRRGEELVRSIRHGQRHAWAMVIRTHAFDQLVLDRVARGAIRWSTWPPGSTRAPIAWRCRPIWPGSKSTCRG